MDKNEYTSKYSKVLDRLQNMYSKINVSDQDTALTSKKSGTEYNVEQVALSLIRNLNCLSSNSDSTVADDSLDMFSSTKLFNLYGRYVGLDCAIKIGLPIRADEDTLLSHGGYYYDYDQEAVQNAEERYNNLLKEEAKAKKEEQKEADISAIDALIDATEKLGDKDVSTLFTDIIEQAVGEYAKNPKSQSTMDVLSQIANGTFNPTTEELMSLIGTINPSGNLQGIIQTNAQDKTAAANNLYENSNITDNSVNIEAVNITVPAGTEAAMAQSLINDFASSVMDEINKLRAKEQ